MVYDAWLHTNLVSDPPTAGTASWNTRAIDGGHFYEMTQLIPVPGLECKLIFGWDAAHSCFISFYHDDLGKHGRTTSAGWADGHPRFTGGRTGLGQVNVDDTDGPGGGARCPGRALRGVLRPRARVVVSGPMMSGKSSLVRDFADTVAAGNGRVLAATGSSGEHRIPWES